MSKYTLVLLTLIIFTITWAGSDIYISQKHYTELANAGFPLLYSQNLSGFNLVNLVIDVVIHIVIALALAFSILVTLRVIPMLGYAITSSILGFILSFWGSWFVSQFYTAEMYGDSFRVGFPFLIYSESNLYGIYGPLSSELNTYNIIFNLAFYFVIGAIIYLLPISKTLVIKISHIFTYKTTKIILFIGTVMYFILFSLMQYKTNSYFLLNNSLQNKLDPEISTDGNLDLVKLFAKLESEEDLTKFTSPTSLWKYISKKQEKELAMRYKVLTKDTDPGYPNVYLQLIQGKNADFSSDKAAIESLNPLLQPEHWYWSLGVCQTNKRVFIDTTTGIATPVHTYLYCHFN